MVERPNGWVSVGNNSAYIFQGDIPRLLVVRKQKELYGQEDEFINNLKHFDKLVFYIGEHEDAKEVIKFVSERKIEPNRVIFASCPCDREHNEKLINSLGLSESTIIDVKCSGRNCFENTLEKFFKEGTLSVLDECYL